MSIEENPCRVVRTLDSDVALLGHKLETDGNILIEFITDSVTNQVSIRRSTKARYEKEFVEANEDLQVLIDYANSVHAGATPDVPPDEGAGIVDPGGNQ